MIIGRIHIRTAKNTDVNKQTKVVQAGAVNKKDTVIPVLIIGSLFFFFGFISWLNSILIPFFKIACELTNLESYLVTFAFYISYLVFSVPASYLLKRVGFRRGMMVGFWIMSVGAFIFIPAALTREYIVFLIGLFSIGAGTALLQTAANPYITILGPRERAAQRLSIMGIFNKVAGIISPLLFAAVVLKATDTELFRQIPLMNEADRAAALDELVRRVIVPYACVGVILIGLGFMIRYSSLPEIDTEHESKEVADANAGKTAVFQFPQLVLGAVAIFLHIGTQIISIDTIISYANSMNIGLLEAKVFPAYTLGATITGYLLGIILIPRFISQLNVLRICTLLGSTLTLLIVFANTEVRFLGHTANISIWFLAMLGIANSLVWPGIWPLALDGLGKYTKVGASILIMGLIANAIMPLVYGHFADVYGNRQAYWVLLPCYLFLVFYAFYGYRLRKWKK